MSKTKRGFIKAGSIITIVGSAIGLLLAFIFLFVMPSIFTEKTIKESYNATTDTIVDLGNGDYVIKTYDDKGLLIEITREEVQEIARISQVVFKAIGGIMLAWDIALMVISIILLNKTSNNIESKGLIISLLVLSALSLNLITLAFMIVALCLKNPKQPILQEN